MTHAMMVEKFLFRDCPNGLIDVICKAWINSDMNILDSRFFSFASE